jgi:hypothetical protein
MKKTGRIIGLGGVVIAMTLASGATAFAKTAAPTSPTAVGAVPGGYKIVSQSFTAAAGTQAFGSVTCPVTSTGVQRKPQSGGVFISSSDLGANVNESAPNGNSWVAYVNNNGSSSTSFSVYAVCAKPRAGYTVRSASFTNFANSEVIGDSVQCPSGTKVLGGGSSNPATSLLVNLNTTIPSGNGWRVDQNNGTSSDTTITIFAVCSKYGAKQHYGIHVGTAVDNPAGTERNAFVNCPSGQSSLGGGIFATNGSVAVNINSTSPVTGGWSNYENNASGADDTITPYVICAT